MVRQTNRKSQGLLNLTKLGWKKENHAFVQVRPSQFQSGAVWAICISGPHGTRFAHPT